MTRWRAQFLAWLLLAPIMACGGVACGGAAAASTGPDAIAHYDTALESMERRDPKTAIVELKTLLQQEPRHLPARVLLGKAYLLGGNATAAEFELLRARDLGADENLVIVPLGQAYLLQGKARAVLEEFRARGRPRDVEVEVLLLRGVAQLQRLQVIEAEQTFLETARLRPDYAAPRLGLAQVSLFRGDVAAAALHVEAAQRLDPVHADVWAMTGDIRRLRGDGAGAIAAYGRAIEHDPLHLSARLGRAGALIDADQIDAAFADVNAVLDVLPNEPQAAYLLAVILARQQRQQNAITVLRELAAILGAYDPERIDNAPALLLIGGVANYLVDQIDQAYVLLSRYRDLIKYNPVANRVLAAILTRRGESQRALALLEESVATAGGDASLLAQLAGAYLGQGQLDRATETFERAAAAFPKQAAIRTQLGLARLWGGDSRRAADELLQALAIDPNARRAEYLLAVSQLQNRDYAAALGTAERLVQRDPANPMAANFRGAAQMGLGDTAAARQSFEQAASLDPRYLPARLNLARLLLHGGDATAARALLIQILSRNSNSVPTLLELAQVDEQAGRIAEAISWTERARNAAPSDRKAAARLMDLYVRENRNDDALTVAREVESLAPDDVDVLEAVGKVELATLSYLRAITTFRRAGELLAGSPEGLHRVAAYLLRARDMEGARQQLRRALLADPGYLPAYAALVEIEIRNGNLGEAMRIAREVGTAQPTAALGLLLQGDILVQQGQLEPAEAAYTAAFAKERSPDTVIRLFRVRRDRGQARAGIKALEDWLSEQPRDVAVRLALANALARAEEPVAAIAHLERIVADGQENAAVLNNLAWLYHERGDARALAFAERAYALAPDDAVTIDTLGWIATLAGQTQRGLGLLREAHARASSDPRVRYHLAVALHRSGRVQEARQELEQALAAGIAFTESDAAQTLLRQIGGGG